MNVSIRIAFVSVCVLPSNIPQQTIENMRLHTLFLSK